MKKTRRVFTIILTFILILSSINVFAAKNEKRNPALNGIIVNGHIVYSDVEPYIKSSRTFVPVRFIAEELGYYVKWDAKEKIVTMNADRTSVELKIGSDNMKVQDKDVKLDAPPEIKDGRTFVPLRAIAEAFGEKVDFSKEYRAVYIGDNPKYDAFYKIVYYYGKQGVSISQFTINIAKNSVDVNGNKKQYKTLNDLINFVYKDFSLLDSSIQEDVSNKTESKASSTKVNLTKSNVPIDMQLKDDKYVVASSSDPLVGTWYAPGSFSSNGSTVDVRNYKYIESLGDNLYKITTRIILSSDPSSELYCEQEGYFDSSTNKIEFPDKSQMVYGGTGYFKGQSPYLFNEEWVLDKSKSKLYYLEIGNEYYFNKY